jgi:hypothetical protein
LRYEGNTPAVETLIAISRGFGVSLDALTGLATPMVLEHDIVECSRRVNRRIQLTVASEELDALLREAEDKQDKESV